MHARFFSAIGSLLLAGVFLIPAVSSADTSADVAARQAQLEAQLQVLNQEIDAQQKILEQKQSEGTSLERDIDIINAQIQKDELSIKARDLNIQSLTGDISDKNSTIAGLDDQRTKELESLADILRKTHAIDAYTVTEVIFSSDSVSSFFQDLDSFTSIKSALQQSFSQIADTKNATAAAKAALEDQRAKEEELRQEQVLQENQVKADKAQEEILLAAVKTQESQYQNVITASKKVIAQIEAELFTLRDTAAIPFGEALSYATAASQKTSVRPALILAVLKQESDLGQNIGACFVVNLGTGDGVSKNSATAYQKVMKAPRDTEPFQAITDALGVPWATAPVSCPKRPIYTTSRGYGGAMGPSQFIPSTWQLYTPRLTAALGAGEPDPWNAKDAVMAAAMYLSDIGASSGTYAAERNAACKYYSGRSCDNRQPPNQFYGDNVMDNAAFFQNQIDLIGG